MAIGGRFDSTRGFWGAHAAPAGIIGAPRSKSDSLRTLERLIGEAQGELKAIAEGRSVYFGFVENMRGRMQLCLVDIGETAQAELREITTMDLKIAADLAQWYSKGVYNDFEVKEGDPADFLRAQANYDRSVSPTIAHMIELLERVRQKMLAIGTEPPKAQPAEMRAFAMPEGCTWPDVYIRFTSDFQVQIEARDHQEIRNYTEMGFEDRRGKRASKPDGNWSVLQRFAESDGAIQSTRQAKDWPKLEKRVQTINARLKMLFGLSENGIFYDKEMKAYRTRFKLIPPPPMDSTDPLT